MGGVGLEKYILSNQLERPYITGICFVGPGTLELDCKTVQGVDICVEYARGKRWSTIEQHNQVFARQHSLADHHLIVESQLPETFPEKIDRQANRWLRGRLRRLRRRWSQAEKIQIGGRQPERYESEKKQADLFVS